MPITHPALKYNSPFLDSICNFGFVIAVSNYAMNGPAGGCRPGAKVSNCLPGARRGQSGGFNPISPSEMRQDTQGCHRHPDDSLGKQCSGRERHPGPE